MSIGIERRENKINNEEMKKQIIDKFNIQSNYEAIFTDGSKSKKGISVGEGIYLEKTQIAYEMSMNKVCSVFTAELVAVQAALCVGLSLEQKQDIVILTDSEAAIKAILNNDISANKSPYAIKAREFIVKIQSQRNGLRKVILVWTPSHCRVEGNEIADLLAKECVMEEHNEEVETLRADWKNKFKIEAWEETNKEILIESKHKGKKYFDLFYEKNKQPWFKKLNNDRNFIVFINRLRANHFNLNESLARKDFINLSDCLCGNKSEDMDHVIFECPLRDEGREVLLKDLEKLKASSPYSIWTWLKRKEVLRLHPDGE